MGLKYFSYVEELRGGAVQPGDKEALGRPYSGLSVLKEGLKENWRGTF